MSPARSTSSPEDPRGTSGTRPGSLARWIPVALWASCIWWFSGEAFSARSTHTYIDPALRFLFGDLSLAEIRFAHGVIRKTAHFVEYAVLAVLLYRALAPAGTPMRRGMLVKTVLWCGIYASADELHQTFERARTGSVVDVALDVAGATSGALTVAWWRRGRNTLGTPTGARPAPAINVRSRESASEP